MVYIGRELLRRSEALEEAEPHVRLCESVHLDGCICLDIDRSQDPSPSFSLYISTQGQRGGKEPF